ncbi:Protein of unknown function [Enhydrobacter aerosaccus]|uniref:DUF1800 domain-containing protein n=1 Tax=Enhydrobacter aerosaccus TaxID=225324 RepID=A0A1T4P3J1_9HYPH|nr:DUF1800 domain-containing protein [Enhydrobacter aerosaccus]SJZ85816.1 Protein of unknown function [Enhydrobacter aerosaccus]
MSFEVDPRTALNKLAFGPSDPDLATIRKMGTGAWLAQQLKPPPEDDCRDAINATRLRLKYSSKTPEAEVDEDRPISVIFRPIEEHWKTVGKEVPGQERSFLRTAVAAATLIRAVHSRWQLREVLVDFWHNHFNVNAVGDQLVAVALPTYDSDVIRRHALGNFREMLEAVATSAAMLIYLNGRSSRGGAANENYGRELFELHTLGRPAYLNALYNKWREVPGALQGHPEGYIDQDVYEAARAFTGWTIEDGAGIGAGRHLPVTGKFTYVETFHDNYQKRVLATEFDPYQPPMADGRRVLDLVADHPATARFVCGKLCRRLVSDNPDPALVNAAVKVWSEERRKPDQIARTVEAIVRSDAFRRSGGAKVKRPLELYASFARAATIPVTPTLGLLGELDGSGQRLFGWGPPTGHPDDNDYWLSSNMMRRRWELLLGLSNDVWKAGPTHAATAVADKATAEEAVSVAHHRLLGVEAPPPVARAIVDGMGLKPGMPFDTRKDALPLSRQILAYCAMTPAFQVR